MFACKNNITINLAIYVYTNIIVLHNFYILLSMGADCC